MMLLSLYKHYFAELLHIETSMTIDELMALIEFPPTNIPGDLAFPCFQLAKQAKQAPNVLASQLAEKFSSPYFSSFVALGGYLNAHIQSSDFIQKFFEEKKNIIPQDKKIMIEYMSANPNKPLHIGQARNVCVGDSMRRIYEYLGYQVTSCNYGDDSGVNVGYNILGHLSYNIPLTSDKKFDHYCGEVYEKMRKLDEDELFKKQLSELLLTIEEGHDPKISALHHDYTRHCAQEQIKSCRRMGAYFDLIAWETDVLHLKFFAAALEVLKAKGWVKFADEGDAK